MQMRKLVHRRMDKLLRALEEAAETARQQAGVEEVHQLRVSTRRLSQNLKTFRPFYAKGDVKKVRGRLRALRDVAADLRTRDIALEQLQAAQLPGDGALASQLQQDRDNAVGKLNQELARWADKKYPQRWHSLLGNGGQA